MQKLDILVISIANPILVGVYRDNKLVENIKKEGMTSEVLPLIFDEIFNKYKKVDTLCYVNGPGSYMAIKVAYIFLKTIAITKKIPLLASSGFVFNNNSPIKALGKKYFFNSLDDTIKIDFLEDKSVLEEFSLPKILEKSIFTNENLPSYNLPAV